jgi:cell division septum initiation protein DivIVA
MAVQQKYPEEPPGTTTDEKQRIAELEREVRQLRHANEILSETQAPTGPEELAAVAVEIPADSMLARAATLPDRTISLDVTHLEQIRICFERPLRKMQPPGAYLAS